MRVGVVIASLLCLVACAATEEDLSGPIEPRLEDDPRFGQPVDTVCFAGGLSGFFEIGNRAVVLRRAVDMVMTGDVRYVHPGEYAAFVTDNSEVEQEAFFEEVKDDVTAWVRQENADASDDEIEQWFFGEFAPLGRAEHRMAWRPTGEIGSWVVRNQSVVIVGDTLFVHGGLSVKYTAYSVEEINDTTTEALNRQTRNRDASIHAPLGPQWYRGLLREPCATMESGIDGGSLTVEQELDIVLAHFGVERIVIGHTPSIEGIKANHNGRVIQIDTGMSAHYGGTNSFLEITNKGTFANNDGMVVKLEEPVAVDPVEACKVVAAP